MNVTVCDNDEGFAERLCNMYHDNSAPTPPPPDILPHYTYRIRSDKVNMLKQKVILK